LGPVFFGALERIVAPRINEVREQLDMPPLKGAAEMFGRPPLLLYLTAEPFEYPRSDWPSNICMVGPCDWDPPADPPPWLDEVDQPIVLVTTSSEFQDDGRLVRCALEALAGEDVDVVATLPSENASDITPPTNARVFSFLAHTPILKRAACAVTHAGMGATQKALAPGVPVCAVPFGRDQLEVARRVEVAQGGLPRAVFDRSVSATQNAKLSGEPKVPNASLRHSRRQEVRSRRRMRSKLWIRRSGQGPPRESERCSPAATTKMDPTDWIGRKHS
jgi:UDP:flavonoid glycosyltransferase YjiC (YdhE family)